MLSNRSASFSSSLKIVHFSARVYCCLRREFGVRCGWGFREIPPPLPERFALPVALLLWPTISFGTYGSSAVALG